MAEDEVIMNEYGMRKRIQQVIEPLILSGTLTLEKEKKQARLKITGTRPNLNYYLFTGPLADYQCFYDHDIIFNGLGIIPTHCQKRCWKVVINCKSAIQAHRLYEILRDENIMGKAGCDPRPYTYGYWRGFCYNYTADDALDKRDYLREIIPDELNSVDPHPDRKRRESGQKSTLV